MVLHPYQNVWFWGFPILHYGILSFPGFFYKSVGGNPNIVVNKKFFFWPACYLMNYMGAIPVDTSKGSSLVKQILVEFKNRKVLHLAIAPEGTRKPTTKWKGGFHVIARAANVPVYFAVFDWGRREVGIIEEFKLTGRCAW